MIARGPFLTLAALAAVVVAGVGAQADTITHPNASGGGSTTITMDFVNVSNAGNANDIHGDGYGAVGYNYRIGTYEVRASD